MHHRQRLSLVILVGAMMTFTSLVAGAAHDVLPQWLHDMPGKAETELPRDGYLHGGVHEPGLSGDSSDVWHLGAEKMSPSIEKNDENNERKSLRNKKLQWDEQDGPRVSHYSDVKRDPMTEDIVRQRQGVTITWGE